MRAKALTLGLISLLLLLGSVLSAKEKKEVNPWQELFTEPIEIVYIIMKDGSHLKQTNYEERLVRMGAGKLETILKKTPYEIKDITIIIHNHRFERKFSPSDWRFYRDLKKRGFEGHFLLYCHWANKVYSIEKKKKPN